MLQRHAHAERGHDLYETPSVAVGIARPHGLAPSRVRGAVGGINQSPLPTVADRRRSIGMQQFQPQAEQGDRRWDNEKNTY